MKAATNPLADICRRFDAIAAPLQREHAGPWFLHFVGTIDAAASSRLLAGRGIPGEPGQSRKSNFFEFESGRRVNVERATSRRVRVRINLTRDETAAIRAFDDLVEDEAAALRRCADLHAQAAALERQQWLPKTAAEFRQGIVDMVSNNHGMARKLYLEGHASGFMIDPGSLAEVDELMSEIVETLRRATIMRGQLRSSPVLDRARRLRVEAAKLDLPLQRFLAEVASGQR